jgi:DNA repair ATPase RecN
MDDLRQRMVHVEGMLAELIRTCARSDARIEEVYEERQRTRKRLHELESDRAALRMLAQQVGEIVKNAEEVAIRAAEKALERNRNSARGLSGLRAQWVSALIAVGCLAVAALALVTR